MTHYHLIGIGGIGMSGLARLLLAKKISVSGSDLASSATTQELSNLGAIIHQGHDAAHVPPSATVVYTSDLKPDNPEYQAAVQMGSPLLHRSDLLKMLSEDTRSLAIAGTHGKTTTSSLLATVLLEAHLSPSFAIGGTLSLLQSNAAVGKGDYFVLEADESDRSFLKYHPFGAIVTNIDNDHLINYDQSMQVLIQSFEQFISQVQSQKHLFWCRDDLHLRALSLQGQSYGTDEKSDWRITKMEQQGFQVVFDLQHHGHIYPNIELALSGKHNALNGAAVFGLAMTLGIKETSIRQSFKSFQGVLRRCENKGNAHGIQFLDDYAHHPTEIQTTLKGIRQAIPSKRLIAIFQPHRYSRTQDCLGSYGTIFDAADILILTDIYAAGESPIPDLSSLVIQKEIKQASSISSYYIPREELSSFLSQFLQSADVVVTLGAGDVTKVASETIKVLSKVATTS